jgi:hypothetical protein
LDHLDLSARGHLGLGVFSMFTLELLKEGEIRLEGAAETDYEWSWKSGGKLSDNASQYGECAGAKRRRCMILFLTTGRLFLTNLIRYDESLG